MPYILYDTCTYLCRYQPLSRRSILFILLLDHIGCPDSPHTQHETCHGKGDGPIYPKVRAKHVVGGIGVPAEDGEREKSLKLSRPVSAMGDELVVRLCSAHCGKCSGQEAHRHKSHRLHG